MVVIKKIETVQDIYIVGNNFKENEGATCFGITDDYHSLKITNENKAVYIETEGIAYILTKSEFDKFAEEIRNDYDEDSLDEIEFVVIKNFVGDVKLKVLSEKDIDVLNSYDDQQDLMYQVEFEEGDYWFDAVIEIEQDFQFKTMADENR